jgi:hypothetical protein
MRVRPQPVVVTQENWIEVACPDCIRSARREAQASSDPLPFRVFHYYAFDGEFVKSTVVY